MFKKQKKFPFYKQYDRTDCGPACLRMIAKYYGKTYFPEYLRNVCHLTHEGVKWHTFLKYSGNVCHLTHEGVSVARIIVTFIFPF